MKKKPYVNSRSFSCQDFVRRASYKLRLQFMGMTVVLESVPTTLDSQVAISNACKIRSQPYHGQGKTCGTYFFNRAGCKVPEDATVVILYQHLSS
jgi:hypothetical protein